MIPNTFNIRARGCVTASNKIAVPGSLKELIWILTSVLDTALEEHNIYEVNLFFLLPSTHICPSKVKGFSTLFSAVFFCFNCCS